MVDLTALLVPIVDISRQAAVAMLEIYQSDFAVEHKQDNSPLTKADLASHNAIVAGLQKLTPDWPILSEESADIDWATRSSWQRYWLVDPLDGTKEFIKRNGEFTVNIALIDNHRSVLSAVLAPVLKTVWFAAEGFGARRAQLDDLSDAISDLDQLGATVIQTRKPTPVRPVVVASRSHVNEALQAYLDQLPEHERLACGSSLKFCRVAEGSADLYPRLGPTSEWDTAAAQCVVEQAGGQVVIAGGEPLDYNSKESILNPEFLVVADRQSNWPDL